MKPEDVPDELVRVALTAYGAAYADGLRPRDCTRAALAAVIPLIEAREREAGRHEAERLVVELADVADKLTRQIAAAIRARGETQ